MIPARLPMPPTPRDLKRKQTETSTKKQPLSEPKKPRALKQTTTGRRFEPVSKSDSEIDRENIQLSIERTVARHSYLPESEREPCEPAATTGIQTTIVAEQEADFLQQAEPKKRARRRRLMSYSSQDSNNSQETTASRKNWLKQAAVTRWEGEWLIIFPRKTTKEKVNNRNSNCLKLYRSQGRGLVVL